MIRVLLFLAAVALAAFGVVWIADRPGDIAIVWQGYRIETSVMVAFVAIALVSLIVVIVWSILRTILRSPDLIAMFLSHRRGVRGYLAISRGLIAIGAGDAATAKRASSEVEQIAPGEPLALLLNAQVAQLSGDRAAAEHAFRAMAERDDTRLLGLRGLFVEAQRRKDAMAARAFAEEAANASPALGWAGQAALEFRCAAGDWSAALAALDRNSRYGLIDKPEYKRQRAVLLTARALAAEETERDRARQLALDALKLAPSLVPAAELAGRLLGDAGELRRASRIIEKAWAANPHPDLADTYAQSAIRRFGARAAGARAVAGAEGAGPGLGAYRERAGGGARSARRAGVRGGAKRDPAVAQGADPARRHADGGDRASRERRRRPQPRMDGARAAGAARSGLDRRRLRHRPLDAGVAGERPARRVPVEGAAGGTRRPSRGDRGRRTRSGQAAGPRSAGASGRCSSSSQRRRRVRPRCRARRRSRPSSSRGPRPSFRCCTCPTIRVRSQRPISSRNRARPAAAAAVFACSNKRLAGAGRFACQ